MSAFTADALAPSSSRLHTHVHMYKFTTVLMLKCVFRSIFFLRWGATARFDVLQVEHGEKSLPNSSFISVCLWFTPSHQQEVWTNVLGLALMHHKAPPENPPKNNSLYETLNRLWLSSLGWTVMRDLVVFLEKQWVISPELWSEISAPLILLLDLRQMKQLTQAKSTSQWSPAELHCPSAIFTLGLMNQSQLFHSLTIKWFITLMLKPHLSFNPMFYVSTFLLCIYCFKY